MSLFKNNWKKRSTLSNNLDAYMDNVSIAPSEVPSEFDTRKKIKYGNTAQAAWGIFSEYCNNSTIHGIKYLGEQKRPLLERLFWIFVFVSSIFMCSQLITSIYVKWNQTPVIVSFAEKSTPVWQIPFPAVTVCPETKARQTFFNFTKVFWDFTMSTQNETTTPEEMYYMQAVSQVCDSVQVDDFEFENKFGDSSIITALEEAAPTFNDTFRGCKWRNMMTNCSELYHKVITEEGICYSFNMMAADELFRKEAIHDGFVFSSTSRRSQWDVQSGYNKQADAETYPERVLGAGARAGLFLLVQGYDKDYDHICRGPVQGFKILLHTPGEMPQVSRQYFRIPFGQEVLVSIKPNMMTTSSGLKDYSPVRRQCFFQQERTLSFFKVYTQANCQLECLANYTLQKCNCVKFSMPRIKSTPICGAANIKCYNDAEDSLLATEFKEGLTVGADGVRAVTKCNCLPACTSIAYDAEISQADFDFKSMFQSFYDDLLEKNPSLQMARLSIFFKENQFITSKRSELYGTTDFLANCGGLLGLFMGVSTLSLVELLYFCTVRLISNLKMRHEKKQKLKQKKNRPAPPEIVVKDSSLDSEKNN